MSDRAYRHEQDGEHRAALGGTSTAAGRRREPYRQQPRTAMRTRNTEPSLRQERSAIKPPAIFSSGHGEQRRREHPPISAIDRPRDIVRYVGTQVSRKYQKYEERKMADRHRPEARACRTAAAPMPARLGVAAVDCSRGRAVDRAARATASREARRSAPSPVAANMNRQPKRSINIVPSQRAQRRPHVLRGNVNRGRQDPAPVPRIFGG